MAKPLPWVLMASRISTLCIPAKHDQEVQLCAFDILALDGEDLRKLPLSMRKTNLTRLLARRPDGIFFETGEIGPDLFRKASEFGLEGLVSKRADRPYRSGRSRDWIKLKNRKHPPMSRVMENLSGISRCNGLVRPTFRAHIRRMTKVFPTFKAQRIRGGWFVAVATGNGPDSHIGGFATKAEAREWIVTKSSYWPGRPNFPSVLPKRPSE